MRTVAVLGSGSWGTALAVHLGRLHHDVRLWGRDRALVDELCARRANAVYLPDVTLPPSVSVTHDLGEALGGVDLVIAAVPSHGLRAVVRSASPYAPSRAVWVSAAKGLESDTMLRMSEVITEEVGGAVPVVVLSGPSFAIEVARQLPTAVLAASSSADATELVQAEFRGSYFRLRSEERRVRERV